MNNNLKIRLLTKKNFADENANEFVQKVAKLFVCQDENLNKFVSFLEKMFPISVDCKLN